MSMYIRYLKKYYPMIFIGLFCVFCEAVCDLMQPTMMSRIIDDGIRKGSVDIVLKHGATMLGISLMGMVFAAARNIMASRVSQSFGADLRIDTFKKVLNFSESAADKLDNGAIITRLTNDSSQMVQFVNGMMRIFFKAPLTCLGAVILAVMLSPRLSLVMFAGIAVVTVFIVISIRMSYSRFNKVQYAIDKVNTVVQEYLSGIRLVKAFGRYAYEEEKFETVNDDLAQKSVKSQLVIVYFSPLMTLAINISIIVIFYIGSLLFTSGDAEVGKIAAFISYMMQILGSLIMITNIFNTFVRTKASTSRVMQIMDSEEDITNDMVSSQADKFHVYDNETNTCQLEFRGVTFAYPQGSGIPALKDLSFKVNKGETLAVIGPTGSGKSTLAWLMMRFYDVNIGCILYNGNDIRELDITRYRQSVAIAPQKSLLFSGTVAENIMWGNKDADSHEVGLAAEDACADSFIKEMPEKFDSLLGQGGVNISGGQKQRLSIARAIIKNAPVLILDDCTSALDAVTEAKVRKGLKRQSATVVMITQRIGTAMTADNILVMENGRSVGFGSHAELLKDCEVYRDIYRSQIGEI